MDALIMEDTVLLKENVSSQLSDSMREKYLSQFELD